jgi:NADH-quinone oxidoreductase subunit B
VTSGEPRETRSPGDDPSPGSRLRALHLPVACCALEALAATSALAALGVDLVDDDPAQADVLVISGTVTHTMAPTISAVHARMRPDARVVAVDQIVPVDRYVPGCPPRPQALVDAITSLLGETA